MSMVTVHGCNTMYDAEEHLALVGTPGGFQGGAGTEDPANLAELQAEVGASPTTPWISPQRVVLVDASSAYWNGIAWVAGTAPAAPTAAEINGASRPTTGGTVWWDNSTPGNVSSWKYGVAPTAAAISGTPGTFVPTTYTPATLAAANIAIPTNSTGENGGTRWAILATQGAPGTLAARYVVFGDAAQGYWNGTDFVTKASVETPLPANLATLQASAIVGSYGSQTPWTITVAGGTPGVVTAQSITLVDASKAYWNGTAWINETVAKNPTQFASIDAIRASVWTGGANWTTGQYITLASSIQTNWDGTSWEPGVHP